LELFDQLFPLKGKLPHVGDIEHPRRSSHRLMFGGNARVLHRHFPTGKGSESRFLF
jgi:hypothetical protein